MKTKEDSRQLSYEIVIKGGLNYETTLQSPYVSWSSVQSIIQEWKENRLGSLDRETDGAKYRNLLESTKDFKLNLSSC